jgi:CheY-like chemotaxis protein
LLTFGWFRRQIRDGIVSFLFAHDGVEALATLAANHDVDWVVADINMPRSSSAASHSQQVRRSSRCEHPKVAILARTNEEPQPKANPYLW